MIPSRTQKLSLSEPMVLYWQRYGRVGCHRIFIWRLKMFKYEIIIYLSSDDEAYIAEVPKLPGCMANGSTYHEVL